jgi:hypothetical protein
VETLVAVQPDGAMELQYAKVGLQTHAMIEEHGFASAKSGAIRLKATIPFAMTAIALS